MKKLPGECDGLLPEGSIVDAIGRTVSGGTAFVVGLPDKSIGRVTYINCRYGVAKKAPTAPAIEIGVSLVMSTSDPADARASLVSASEAGLAAFRETQTQRTQVLGEVLGPWPQEDRDNFVRLLTLFNAELEANISRRRDAEQA